MSYADGEAAALALIQTISGWTEENTVSLANDATNKAAALVNSGKDYKYCFLEPSTFDSKSTGIGVGLDETTWRTSILLVCFAAPRTNESPVRVLIAQRQLIKDKLDAYFELNAENVTYAKVVSGLKIERYQNTKKAPFVMQEMILEWTEETELTQHD